MSSNVSEEDKFDMREAVQETLLGGGGLDELHETYSIIRNLYGEFYTENEIGGVISYKFTPEGELVLEKDHAAVSRYQEWLRSQAINALSNHDNTDVNDEGVDFDYNTPEKQEWRAECRKFISENMTDEELKNAKVLIFCATEWYEVEEVFDPLRIERQNIWGAEYNPKLQNAAATKAEVLGTNFYQGNVKKLFDESNEKFDIVILDHKGQLSHTAMDLLADLPVNDRAIVITNHKRNREQKDIQHYARLAAQSRTLPVDMKRNYDRLAVIKAAEKEIKKSPVQLREALSYTMGDYQFNLIGINRKEEWICPEMEEAYSAHEGIYSKNSRGRYSVTLEKIVDGIGYHVLDRMRQLIDRHHLAEDGDYASHENELYTQQMIATLLYIITNPALGTPVTTARHEFAYNSPPNNSPFISAMAAMERPLVHRKILHITKFLFKAIAETSYEEEIVPIALENKQRKILEGVSPDPMQDSFALYSINSGKRIASLQLKEVFRCMNALHEYYDSLGDTHS